MIPPPRTGADTGAEECGMPTQERKLTDELVRRLPLVGPAELPTRYVVRDKEQPGLTLVVGRRSKAFTVSVDLRRDDKRVASLRRVLGQAVRFVGRTQHTELSVREARAMAQEQMG